MDVNDECSSLLECYEIEDKTKRKFTLNNIKRRVLRFFDQLCSIEEKIEQKMQGRGLVTTSLWPEKMFVSKEFMAENRWQL